MLFERQPKPAQPVFEPVENLDGWRDDLVADAITGKYGNPGVVRQHFALFPMGCGVLRVQVM